MNKLRFYLSWYSRLFLSKCGLYNPWKGKEGTLTCVVLHGVCKNYQKYINGRFIREAELESFIQILHEKVKFVSLKQVKNRELDPNKPNILLTFDDGYQNNLSLAVPILNKFQVPAVICITGQTEPLWMDALDTLQAFNPAQLNPLYKKLGFTSNKAIKQNLSKLTLNELIPITLQLREMLMKSDLTADQRLFVNLLSEDELIQLNNNALIDLINHGYHHVHASTLSDTDLLVEFEKVKRRLKNVDSTHTDVLVPPFGMLTTQQAEYLYQHGYKLQLMMDEKYSNTYQVSRITYNPFFSPNLNFLVLGKGGFYG